MGEMVGGGAGAANYGNIERIKKSRNLCKLVNTPLTHTTIKNVQPNTLTPPPTVPTYQHTS